MTQENLNTQLIFLNWACLCEALLEARRPAPTMVVRPERDERDIHWNARVQLNISYTSDTCSVALITPPRYVCSNWQKGQLPPTSCASTMNSCREQNGRNKNAAIRVAQQREIKLLKKSHFAWVCLLPLSVKQNWLPFGKDVIQSTKIWWNTKLEVFVGVHEPHQHRLSWKRFLSLYGIVFFWTKFPFACSCFRKRKCMLFSFLRWQMKQEMQNVFWLLWWMSEGDSGEFKLPN